MIRPILFLIVLFPVFSSAAVFADSVEPIYGSNCPDAQYLKNKFRPETIKDLPFPPGAFVEIKKCGNADLPENLDFSREDLKKEEIEKQKTIQKLSLLLAYIYNQQKSLAGSYQETDQAYEELLKKSVPNLKAYDETVSNYEDAIKNYGEYEAYLSALPRAVSDYEKKMGTSFKNSFFQKTDGAISLVKTSPAIDLSKPASDLITKVEVSNLIQKTPGELKAKLETAKEKEESRWKSCALMGGFSGVAAAENVVLAALSNPMGILLGASLGATLCSETIYEKMTGLQKRLGKGLVAMGSYIKDGLSEIGNGLFNIGSAYLYKTPSDTGAKIAEHYEKTRSWLSKKLGWQ